MNKILIGTALFGVFFLSNGSFDLKAEYSNNKGEKHYVDYNCYEEILKIENEEFIKLTKNKKNDKKFEDAAIKYIELQKDLSSTFHSLSKRPEKKERFKNKDKIINETSNNSGLSEKAKLKLKDYKGKIGDPEKLKEEMRLNAIRKEVEELCLKNSEYISKKIECLNIRLEKCDKFKGKGKKEYGGNHNHCKFEDFPQLIKSVKSLEDDSKKTKIVKDIESLVSNWIKHLKKTGNVPAAVLESITLAIELLPLENEKTRYLAELKEID